MSSLSWWDELLFIDEDTEPLPSSNHQAGSESQRDIDPEVGENQEEDEEEAAKEWMEILGNYVYNITENFEEVKQKCRKGIPQAIRGEAWYWLSGGQSLTHKNADVYTSLMEATPDPTVVNEIQRDLHRIFPNHELFANNGPGQQDLFYVLTYYSIWNKRVGYCQAQGPVAAFILMHMAKVPTFWSFAAICDDILADYYEPGLARVIQDGKFMYYLLKKYSPIAYDHLQSHKIEPFFFITDWFMGVYTRTLPEETLVRVWDMFLCEGFSVIIKVALVLIKGCLGSESLTRKYVEMHQTLHVLSNLPNHVVEEEFVLNEVQKIDLRAEFCDYAIMRNSYKKKI